MFDNSQPSDTLNDLPAGLHRAVQAVRSEPIPADAAERAMERARQQVAKARVKPQRSRFFFPIAASIAAMLCVSAVVWLREPPRHFALGVSYEPGKSISGIPAQRESAKTESIRGKKGGTGALSPSEVLDDTSNSAYQFYKHGRSVAGIPAPKNNGGKVVPGESTIQTPTFKRPSVSDQFKAGEVDMNGQTAVRKDGKPAANRNDGETHYPGTEAYGHFKDNPFLRPIKEPLSTFSTTVDTASYSNVRRFLLTENRLPPPDAVRVAELINYFPYKYQQPRGDDPVAFRLDIASCPWQPKHHLARIALKGKELDPRQLPARNFVFLLDTSGSMMVDNRLPLLKKSLELLVEQLGPNDRVSMVAYAGSAGLVLGPTPGNDKNTILGALQRLEAGGSTNGGQGIQLAYKIARETFIQGGINRVILGTDGDFNVGVTNEGDLVRLIEQERKSGVFLTILGYGMGNLKDSNMERLAHHGSGRFAYIDTIDEARKIFVEQGCSLVTIAKDVKLQVEFNPRTVGAYRLIGYENKLMRAEDFNDDTKFAGDMGSGHTVTALYEIVPPGLPVPGENVDPLKYQKPAEFTGAADTGEWLTVKMRYKDPQADTSKLLSQPLMGGVEKFGQAPEDFRFAAAVASFGMLLRNSEFRGDVSYRQVRELAKDSLGKDENGHRAEFLKLVDAAGKLSAQKQ